MIFYLTEVFIIKKLMIFLFRWYNKIISDLLYDLNHKSHYLLHFRTIFVILINRNEQQ